MSLAIRFLAIRIRNCFLYFNYLLIFIKFLSFSLIYQGIKGTEDYSYYFRLLD